MIIWGRKAVRRHLGYAADFCPICACARPFAITRVGMAGHVYYITAGDGDLVGFERACLVCTTALKADPALYAEMAKQPAAISALMKQTFPNFADVYRDRLTMEQAIRLDPTMLSAADRQNLLMQPFMLMSVKVSERFAATHFSSSNAFMQREVLPILARALRRLRPSEAELKAALTRLVQMKEAIGSKVKLADLMAEIQRAPTPDRVPAAGQAGSAAVPLVGDEARTQHNAGRLLRILAYISAAGIVGLGAMTFVPGELSQSPNTLRAMLVVGAALAFGVYRAGLAVTQGQSWGRFVGMAFGAASLFGFPIGTALGIYLLWSLGLRWSGPTATA